MSVIDEYLTHIPSPQRDELERIRRIIANAIPDATEIISYNLPAFAYKGVYIIGFAACKNHLSIYPTSGPIDVLKDKLSGFGLSRGTIRFTLKNQLSESLIKELVACRMNTITQQ